MNPELQLWDFCTPKVALLRSKCTTFAALLHDFRAPKVPLLALDRAQKAIFPTDFPGKTAQKRHSDSQNGRKLLQNFRPADRAKTCLFCIPDTKDKLH